MIDTAAWHRDLLELMSKSDHGQTTVISDETKESLIEYLGFRHVVRHTYSRHLDSDRIQGLAERLDLVWPKLHAEVLQFLERELPSGE